MSACVVENVVVFACARVGVGVRVSLRVGRLYARGVCLGVSEYHLAVRLNGRAESFRETGGIFFIGLLGCRSRRLLERVPCAVLVASVTLRAAEAPTVVFTAEVRRTVATRALEAVTAEMQIVCNGWMTAKVDMEAATAALQSPVPIVATVQVQRLLGTATVETAKTRAPTSAQQTTSCLLYTSPSPRDGLLSRMPSSA